MESFRSLPHNVIDLSQPDDERTRRIITEQSEGAGAVSRESLVAGNEWCAVEEQAVHYEAPLTAEVVLDEYTHAVSLETGSQLFETVPGTEDFDRTLEAAGEEILGHYLWRMGLPSELSGLLDINDIETRGLLGDLYERIPEDVNRDNSANAFAERWEAIKDHLYEKNVSTERRQDIIDIWRGDLMIRVDLTKGEKEAAASQMGVFREERLQGLLSGEEANAQTVNDILNTLLPRKPDEIHEFRERVTALQPETEEAQRSKEMLLSRIDEYYPQK